MASTPIPIPPTLLVDSVYSNLASGRISNQREIMGNYTNWKLPAEYSTRYPTTVPYGESFETYSILSEDSTISYGTNVSIYENTAVVTEFGELYYFGLSVFLSIYDLANNSWRLKQQIEAPSGHNIGNVHSFRNSFQNFN